MARILFVVAFFYAWGANAQTVVKMDLPSAVKLLHSHQLDGSVPMLRLLANNYKQYSNIRVLSKNHKGSLATLARALRTDFDGSGQDYIPELTIWSIDSITGYRTFLAASMLNRKSVLLSADLDYLRGMLAYELLNRIRSGNLSLRQAHSKAMQLGIEMQVSESEEGERRFSFFGRDPEEERITGKMMVIEPPDFLWE